MLGELLDPGTRNTLSLAEILAEAPALTRIDRKYVVPVDLAQEMLASLYPAWGVLSLDGRRTTHYRSTYFDSADLDTARAHVQRRRRRWKARSRLYVEDRLCRMEVKAKDGRGHTVKSVVDSTADRYGCLSHVERDFVTSTLRNHAIRVDVHRLMPSMEVSYERMTLARTDHLPARMTIDWGVACALADERMWIDEGHVLVETKGDLQPSDADRLLATLGVRPRPFSKYAAAASLLRSDIADNDVRRLRGRVLHTSVAHHQRSHLG